VAVEKLPGTGAISQPSPPERKVSTGGGSDFINSLREVFKAETSKMKKVPGIPEEVFTANPQTLASLDVTKNISRLV